MALLMPTTRGRNQLDAASGTMPRRANTNPMRAVSDARRMSIGRVMVTPTPTAGPLMAAITGFSDRKMRSEMRPPSSRQRWPDSSTPSGRSNVRSPIDMSAPAQNARPLPVTTTTRTSSSASLRSKASRSSSTIDMVTALRASGRLSVSVSTPSLTS